MDPINIIIGLNIIATFGANVGAAKKGIKDKVGVFKDKPKTYLQTLPLMLSIFSLLVLIVSVFKGLASLQFTGRFCVQFIPNFQSLAT